MISEDIMNQSGEDTTTNQNDRSVIQMRGNYEISKMLQPQSKCVEARILGDEIRESQVPLPSLIDSLNKSMNNISAILMEERNSHTVQKTISPFKIVGAADNLIFEIVD